MGEILGDRKAKGGGDKRSDHRSQKNTSELPTLAEMNIKSDIVTDEKSLFYKLCQIHGCRLTEKHSKASVSEGGWRHLFCKRCREAEAKRRQIRKPIDSVSQKIDEQRGDVFNVKDVAE